MCIICVQYELGKLTKKEAINNLKEVLLFSKDAQHAKEALNDLTIVKEIPIDVWLEATDGSKNG